MFLRSSCFISRRTWKNVMYSTVLQISNLNAATVVSGSDSCQVQPLKSTVHWQQVLVWKVGWPGTVWVELDHEKGTFLSRDLMRNDGVQTPHVWRCAVDELMCEKTCQWYRIQQLNQNMWKTYCPKRRNDMSEPRTRGDCTLSFQIKSEWEMFLLSGNNTVGSKSVRYLL